jgi:hypothetical protein
MHLDHRQRPARAPDLVERQRLPKAPIHLLPGRADVEVDVPGEPELGAATTGKLDEAQVGRSEGRW